MAECVVSIELEFQKSFSQEQMYIALGRTANINQLYLIEKYDKATLKVDVSAKKEYEKLQTKNVYSNLSLKLV